MPENNHQSTSSKPGSKSGWDGKLRVEKRATVTNTEILSDPEYSDEEAPPVEKIAADEGEDHLTLWPLHISTEANCWLRPVG